MYNTGAEPPDSEIIEHVNHVAMCSQEQRRVAVRSRGARRRSAGGSVDANNAPLGGHGKRDATDDDVRDAAAPVQHRFDLVPVTALLYESVRAKPHLEGYFLNVRDVITRYGKDSINDITPDWEAWAERESRARESRDDTSHRMAWSGRLRRTRVRDDRDLLSVEKPA